MERIQRLSANYERAAAETQAAYLRFQADDMNDATEYTRLACLVDYTKRALDAAKNEGECA